MANAGVWHPILSTLESPPGRFVLFDGSGNEVAEIVLVRRGAELGYRATRMLETGETELVGYFLTALAAVKAAHLRVISGYGHPGGPVAWGD